jgi:curved DNA-binding protein CbpA
MNTTGLQCPYCHISLSVTSKGLENKRVSLRCKFCYGIFSFMPYDKRIIFSKNRNYYEVFGLDRNADLETIRSRFRELVLKFHPDRRSDIDFATEKMKQINCIYSVLGDKTLRQEYDAALGFEEEFEDVYSNYEPPHYIYQDSIEIIDAVGLSVIIKTREYIYFPAERYLSIFGKRFKLKGKDYVGVKVQKIFNPKYKNEYEKVLRKNLEREPLFSINFGNEEMIIFKEDFQKIWISQKSLNQKDIKTVIISVFIIILLIVFGLSYLYRTYTLDINDKGELEVIRK